MVPPGVPRVHDVGGHGRAAHFCSTMPPMNALTAPARTASSTPSPFGERLRHWRQRRRLSQLDLAEVADVSTRHLSYVETGRASPSRDMVLRLVDRLDVPLRERNALLEAAGYAPMYRERALDAPDMASARAAVKRILDCHEPWPALAMDRHWNLVMANRMVPLLIAGAAPALLEGPINVLRLSLHSDGLAPRIANLRQWREHLFERLRQQIHLTGDATLAALLAELKAYPESFGNDAGALPGEHHGVLMPFQFHTAHGVLNLVSTTTVFGSPVDITLQELALETFFPADEASAELLRRHAVQA
jgi:transcriptional regulator with XRE-family HTH domain